MERSEGSVIAISSGEYSDYKIWAVFDDEEKAALYQDQLALIEYNVKAEPLPLNPTPPRVIQGIMVAMKRNGDTDSRKPVRHYYLSKLGFSHYGFESYKRFDDKILHWIVRTQDPTRAIKVTNEVRVQLIAADVWGNSDGTRAWLEMRNEPNATASHNIT